MVSCMFQVVRELYRRSFANTNDAYLGVLVKGEELKEPGRIVFVSRIAAALQILTQQPVV